MVNHLLLNGVSVHQRDRYDRTPLLEAISQDHHEIIQLLVTCGAHMTGSLRALGEHLCAAACRGSIKRLQSYYYAGADLSQPDPSGRTALHIAALHGQADVVKFLLPHMPNIQEVDMLGLSAMDYAKRGNHENVINLLNNKR